ncbi:hypothetical protein QYE76_062100 [Lolium multiflorum]|uniref:Uncharacterized protein n=1 Tax=Lolium multiflorum TaxID=4521 RepID=A0AAD8S4L4_LOLMU|nr:hypothetical protein QYE76_062100 [Lolium multiflorum]
MPDSELAELPDSAAASTRPYLRVRRSGPPPAPCPSYASSRGSGGATPVRLSPYNQHPHAGRQGLPCAECYMVKVTIRATMPDSELAELPDSAAASTRPYLRVRRSGPPPAPCPSYASSRGSGGATPVRLSPYNQHPHAGRQGLPCAECYMVKVTIRATMPDSELAELPDSAAASTRPYLRVRRSGPPPAPCPSYASSRGSGGATPVRLSPYNQHPHAGRQGLPCAECYMVKVTMDYIRSETTY